MPPSHPHPRHRFGQARLSLNHLACVRIDSQHKYFVPSVIQPLTISPPSPHCAREMPAQGFNFFPLRPLTKEADAVLRDRIHSGSVYAQVVTCLLSIRLGNRERAGLSSVWAAIPGVVISGCQNISRAFTAFSTYLDPTNLWSRIGAAVQSVEIWWYDGNSKASIPNTG
ncbi:hypothetical protein VTK26DRAFT_2107 [Humicola hyalothermophila]